MATAIAMIVCPFEPHRADNRDDRLRPSADEACDFATRARTGWATVVVMIGIQCRLQNSHCDRERCAPCGELQRLEVDRFATRDLPNERGKFRAYLLH